MIDYKKVLFESIKASFKAADIILQIYETDFDIEIKSDNSPLTVADKNSSEIIIKHLKTEFPDLPLLSEESKVIPYKERAKWDKYWLIDPLDGTKEFIKKNGEFTVNIALIEGIYPTSGVIYSPVLDILYFGSKNTGSFKLEKAKSYRDKSFNEIIALSKKLPIDTDINRIGIVASRSHFDDTTKNFIDNIKEKYKNIELINIGSSLKLCLVAEGRAKVYPRFAPTSEWDIAAGQAIIENSGGNIYQAENIPELLRYNKENLLNPYFVAVRNELKI